MSEHDVTVDRDSIDGELLRYGQPGPGNYQGRGEYGPGPAPETEPPSRPWKTVALWIAQGLRAGAPNWPITDDETEQLQADIETALDTHFPGGMSMADSWGPLPKLLATIGMIAFTHGVKFDGGGLQLVPPIVLQEPEPEDQGTGATVGGDPPPAETSSTDQAEASSDEPEGAGATIG